jgi:hypothetical protein
MMQYKLSKKELDILEDLRQPGVTLQIAANALVVFPYGDENYYTIPLNNAEHIMDVMEYVRSYGRGKDKVNVYRLATRDSSE